MDNIIIFSRKLIDRHFAHERINFIRNSSCHAKLTQLPRNPTDFEIHGGPTVLHFLIAGLMLLHIYSVSISKKPNTNLELRTSATRKNTSVENRREIGISSRIARLRSYVKSNGMVGIFVKGAGSSSSNVCRTIDVAAGTLQYCQQRHYVCLRVYLEAT